MAYEFQSLTLPAGQGVDWLPEAEVAQTDFPQQLQFPHCPMRGTRVRKGSEEFNGLVNGRFKQVRDGPFRPGRSRADNVSALSRLAPRFPALTDKGFLVTVPPDFYLQNVRPITAAIAVRAADEHVTEKLHLDFFEAGAPTAFALTLAGIEAERAGVQAALFRRAGLGEEFADFVECADVNRGVRARRFAERRLVHENGRAKMFPAGQRNRRLMIGGWS